MKFCIPVQAQLIDVENICPCKDSMVLTINMTVSDKNQYQQTANDTSTQMTKIGCYVSNITDKLVTPGKYFTAAQYHARRLKANLYL
eukprot:g39031.t1